MAPHTLPFIPSPQNVVAAAGITEIDVSLNGIDDGTDNTVSGYTAPSGTDLLLWGIHAVQDAGAGTIELITTVDYGVGSMTHIGRNSDFSSGQDQNIQWFYLKEADIPAGSNDFVADKKNNSDWKYVVIIALSGVDQTTPIDAALVGTDYLNDSTPTQSITTATDGARIYASCTSWGDSVSPAATAIPDQGDELMDVALDPVAGDEASAHLSGFTKTTAGAETMGFTLSSVVAREIIAAFAIRPA